jgi:hypothetical protein
MASIYSDPILRMFVMAIRAMFSFIPAAPAA